MKNKYQAKVQYAALVMLAAMLTACGGGGDAPPQTQTPTPAPASYSIGGSVAGLADGQSVTLRNNATDDLARSANGAFTFSTRLSTAASYAVTVLTQPTGQTCTVANGTGTVGSANVTNVAVTCAASGGTLDTTFGPNQTGLVTHNSAAGGSSGDLANALTLDAQGRILTAGLSQDAAGQYSMAVWRYNTNGTPDTSFNSVGFATHAGVGGETIGTGVAVDSSGRVVVTGHARDAAGNWGMALWRFTSAGALDASFGGSGFVRFSSSHAGAFGLTLDSAGRILVAGYLFNGTDWDSTVWRYLPDGTLDSTFNGLGYNTTSFSPVGDATLGEDIGAAIAHDSAGRVLLTGYSRNGSGVLEMYVARYTTAGVLEASFNGAGIVRYGADGAGDAVGTSIVIDASQRIVVGGSRSSAAGADKADAAVWRLLPTGALDTSFNGAGFASHNGAAGGNDAEEVRGVAIDASGRIVLAGSSKNSDAIVKMVAWRYTAAGVLDTSFGGTGFFVDPGGRKSTARGVRIDGQGRLVFAGQKNSETDADLGIWRINP